MLGTQLEPTDRRCERHQADDLCVRVREPFSELEGLVDTWCDLVVQKGFERQPGQVARILRK